MITPPDETPQGPAPVGKGPSASASATVRANGQDTTAPLPCSIREFLLSRGLSPRSVVVEHNGDAVAPSEFSSRQLRGGDRLEIVRIVAGG